MTADNHVFYGSGRSKLPDWAVVIKTYPKYTDNQEAVITEHEYER